MSGETKTEAKEQQAIQPRGPGALEPTNLEEAWRLAKALASSSIVPREYQKNEANVMAALMMGRDLGISAMQAMREIYVVHGRPASSALLKVALVMQSPLCVYWRLVESTDKQATFETLRRGHPEPVRHTYAVTDATAARLLPAEKDSNWAKRPKLMLRRRCESELADEVYPDVVKGLRTEDEAEEIARNAREVLGVRVDLGAVKAPPPAPEPAKKPETQREKEAAPVAKAEEQEANGITAWGAALQAIRTAKTALAATAAAEKAKTLAEGPQDEAEIAEAMAARLEKVGA